MALSQETIRDIATLLRIVHHIPGRVRLKLEGAATGAGLAQAVADAQRFVRSATATPGIRAVSLNVLARSCVVEYDPRIISPAAWQDLVDGNSTEPAEALLGALAAAPG